MLHTLKIPMGDVTAPGSLSYHLQRYLAFLEERAYSAHTVYSFGLGVRHFIAWCEERSLCRPEELTRIDLEAYQRHLFHYRKANGEPFSEGTQHTRLIPVKLWLKWLVKRGVIPFNPAADLELPKRGTRLPAVILTARETEIVLALPDLQKPRGLRDRAILETFYSSAIRRMELAALKVQDVDFERGILMIRRGKGKKDRVVPIGERALLWIGAYLERGRPELVQDEDNGRLFLSYRGRGFQVEGLSRLVRHYIATSGLGKKGSCHLFRHTAATLMHENGADIRVIQLLLGHARLETTQIYAQVSIRHLKAIHTATHPGKLAQVDQHPLEDNHQE